MKDLLTIQSQDLAYQKIIDWAYTEELKATTYQHFDSWVKSGYYKPLNYLADERKEKRMSLDLVFPKAQAALVFLFDYREAKSYIESIKPKNKIASYTIGFEDQDYHHWIKERLIEIAKKLELSDFDISLDVHPVLERDLAHRAGLGWFGKNSMLISRDYGSLFLIGTLILHEKLELTQRDLETDHCGNCRKCIDACPTNAILENSRTLDSSKCISAYTIEVFKDAEPPKGYPTDTHEIFGCDICQEVCPWVKKNSLTETLDSSWLVDFFNRPQSEIYREVEGLSNKKFKEKFKTTSLERLGKRGLLKNLKQSS